MAELDEEHRIQRELDRLRLTDKVNDIHKDVVNVKKDLEELGKEFNSFREVVRTFNTIKKLLLGLLAAAGIALINKFFGTSG
jgi:hypothetical protein